MLRLEPSFFKPLFPFMKISSFYIVITEEFKEKKKKEKKKLLVGWFSFAIHEVLVIIYRMRHQVWLSASNVPDIFRRDI